MSNLRYITLKLAIIPDTAGRDKHNILIFLLNRVQLIIKFLSNLYLLQRDSETITATTDTIGPPPFPDLGELGSTIMSLKPGQTRQLKDNLCLIAKCFPLLKCKVVCNFSSTQRIIQSNNLTLVLQRASQNNETQSCHFHSVRMTNRDDIAEL